MTDNEFHCGDECDPEIMCPACITIMAAVRAKESEWMTHVLRQLDELGVRDHCEIIADNDGNICAIMEPEDWEDGDNTQ
jgi:hypothetical protein